MAHWNGGPSVLPPPTGAVFRCTRLSKRRFDDYGIPPRHRFDHRCHSEWLGKEYSSVTEGRARPDDRCVGISSGLDRLPLPSDAAVSEASKPYAHSRRQVDSAEPAQGNDYRRGTEIAAARTECRQ